MNTVLHGSDPRVEQTPAGGKARALGRLTRAGFPVPGWCVVLPGPGGAELPPTRMEVESVESAVSEIESSRDGRFAVRSSALDEDGAEHSFAGQLDSFLFVGRAEIAARIADVRASGLNERVREYRRRNGLEGAPPTPAVIVQAMLDPEASGVAFSADPVTGRRGVAVVSAVPGLGSGLVSGECDADTFRVAGDGAILGRTIAEKRECHRFDPGSREGVSLRPVADPAAPAIPDEVVLEVAELARRCAGHFGRPQDIEWAWADGRLWLLQSRPITALKDLPDPDARYILWDNSNICESYPGVTTPLTFSFARRVYEEVYREFCRILGVPESEVAANEETFRCMLGLLRGRIYYNLLNWYRVLSLLPGFDLNRGFMEQMMGVKEPLPDELARQVLEGRGKVSRFKAWGRAVTGVRSLFRAHRRFKRAHAAFLVRLNAALELKRRTLGSMRLDELAGHYRELESRLIRNWDAPLVNDFLAMIFFGVLRKLCARWCGEVGESLCNELLATRGGIVSAEPAMRVREIAEAVKAEPALARALVEGSPDAQEAALGGHPDIRRRLDEYLAKFGDRCLEELKLETIPLSDNPAVLYRTVGALAVERASDRSGSREDAGSRVATESSEESSSGKCEGPSAESPRPERAGVCSTAGHRALKAIGWNPARRLVFRWVLANTRARVRDRENLRFERTRVFGRVRRIFLEIGRRLAAEDALAEPRDIFFLGVDEILGFVEGTTVSPDLKPVVDARRAAFAGFRDGPQPPERFSTFGAPAVGNSMAADASSPGVEAPAGDVLRGLGCCPGKVRGRARVVRDPAEAVIHPGEILVAERTDPGWIMLFASAAGVAVERGSLLSHSAIVTREMSIPGIVSVPGLTGWVEDGEEVEIDGGRGTIRKIT